MIRRGRRSRWLFALALAVVALLVGACEGDEDATPSATTPSGGGSPTQGPSELSMEAVYAGIEATLHADPQQAYRFDVLATGTSGETTTSTVWASPSGEEIRREWGPTDIDPQQYVTIADGSGAYTLGPNGSISIDERTCPGAGPAASLLLDCPNRPFETYIFDANGSPRAVTEEPEIEVTATTFEGAPAIEVTAFREVQPYRSNPYAERRRLYLDPGTFLPRFIEIVQEPGGRQTFRFESETVAAADLTSDFFDPSTLATLRPDPQDVLRERAPEVTSYWLGANVDGSEDVPALELWHASTYREDESDPSTEQLTLEYVRPGTFGQPLVVRLTQYTAARWEAGASGAHLPTDPCWISEEIALGGADGGTATIYSGFHWPDSIPAATPEECPTDRARDRFLAVVSVGDARVVIAPWEWPEQSRDGVAALAETLRAWSD